MLSKKIKNKNGITLVSLVITIIILLILAGITIYSLTNTGLFGKAKEAKQASQNAEKEQKQILSEYKTELDQYNENTLVYKVNSGTIEIGDYVKYTPDTVSNTDEKYKSLISNLGTYSGSSANTISTIKQDGLEWRILDVKDGHVRIIGSTPTNSKIEFKSFNGYNNAVKLLDDACNILYYNSKLVTNVQNLKVEDILDYVVNKPVLDNTEYKPTKIYYPNIFKQEENNITDAKNNQTMLKQSEQNEFETDKSFAETKTLKNTNWNKWVNLDSFTNKKYYELFISKNLQDYDETYWLSSRCTYASSNGACFNLRCVKTGLITYNDLYATSGNSAFSSFSFRPVITLDSGVKIDVQNSGDGSSVEKAYVIKE